MPLSRQQIGQRLRAAREACRMSQDEVARWLGVSRPTFIQIEQGNRPVNPLELQQLAQCYGRDPREFQEEEFREDGALVALFRANPDVARNKDVADILRRCVSLGRELAALERLLEIDRGIAPTAIYSISPPHTKQEAIEQGMWIAGEERRRLGLGTLPIADIVEILELQGVCTQEIAMPDDVSGLMLGGLSQGLIVAVNALHPIMRKRFSYAHECAHVILDRNQLGTVSRASARDDLVEVRANVFAIHFLMPEEGVRKFMTALGKTTVVSIRGDVFDGRDRVQLKGRMESRAQGVQLYDLVQLARHFGVSGMAAIYQLHNLKIITDSQVVELREKETARSKKATNPLLDVDDAAWHASSDIFRKRLLGLGLEALRQRKITRSHLVELTGMLHPPIIPDELGQLLHDVGLDGAGIAD